jgi:hypothetical protein
MEKREESDYGTPELRAKRHQKLTTEPLDLCLQNSLISQYQHWCGLHLRWLYTLRYGAPSISCSQYQRLDGFNPRQDDEGWRQDREQEYKEAICELNNWRCYEIVMSVCVYQHRPLFLDNFIKKQSLSPSNSQRAIQRDYQQFVAGLSVLEKIWQKGKKR